MRALTLLCTLALSACAPILPSPRISIADHTCGGLMLTHSAFLTSAHCALHPGDAELACDLSVSRVSAWHVHPSYARSAWDDLAIGELEHPIGCFVPFSIREPREHEPVLLNSRLGQVDDIWGSAFVADIAPGKFCPGDSGSVVTDGWGNPLGLVSRAVQRATDARGCSFHARVVSLDAHRAWINGVMAKISR